MCFQHLDILQVVFAFNKKDGGTYSAEDIAEAAERIGFGGIGLMQGACHLDNRDCEPFVNDHWFGDECDGRNYIQTFQRGTVFDGERTEPVSDPVKLQKKVTITIDDHQYSGLLTED